VKTLGDKHYSCAVLPPGKTWCPMWKRLGRFQELVWTAWKILPPAGLYPWTVQPIAIPCTDKAIQTAIFTSTKTLFSQPEEESARFSETSFSAANHACYQNV